MAWLRGTPTSVGSNDSSLIYTPFLPIMVLLITSMTIFSVILPNPFFGSHTEGIPCASVTDVIRGYGMGAVGCMLAYRSFISSNTVGGEGEVKSSSTATSSYLRYSLVFSIAVVLWDMHQTIAVDSSTAIAFLPHLLLFGILATGLHSYLPKMFTYLLLVCWIVFIHAATPSSTRGTDAYKISTGVLVAFVLSSWWDSVEFRKLSAGEGGIIACVPQRPKVNLSSYALSLSVIAVSSPILGSALFGTSGEKSTSFLSVWIVVLCTLTTGLIVCFELSINHVNGALRMSTTNSGEIRYLTGIVLTGTALLFQSLEVSNEGYHLLLSLHLGALSTLLVSATVGFCTEQWYPVGSGQFMMTAWDSVLLLVYFVAPGLILANRANVMYGVSFLAFLEPLFPGASASQSNSLPSLLLLLVTTLLSFGISSLQSYTSLYHNWSCKLHTHGQPNSGLIAVTVMLNDLNGKLKKGRKGAINVFVTIDNLEERADEVCELVRGGHEVGVATAAGGAEAEVEDVVALFEQVVKKKPKWYMGVGGHLNPNCICRVNSLGLRVALWSTLVEGVWAGSKSPELTDLDQKIVETNTDGELEVVLHNNITTKRGGNIVHVRAGGDGETAIEIIDCIVDVCESLEDVRGNGKLKFQCDSLEKVCKHDHSLVL